jgi:hypothetical protein
MQRTTTQQRNNAATTTEQQGNNNRTIRPIMQTNRPVGVMQSPDGSPEGVSPLNIGFATGN